MANMLASIFGSSPVMPLENHVDIAYRCANNLSDFFAAVVRGDYDSAAKVRDEIDTLEHEADELKKEIRLHLPKSLFMPVPRQDLLELLLVQDRIANRTRDVAGLVMIRRTRIPAEIAVEFMAFVDRVIDAVKQARESVRELDELYTTGFRGAEAELVAGLINELERIETETDAMEMALYSALFEIEASLNPVDVVFLYRVIELIGEVADMSERVGRRLEMLLSH